jgi:DNA-binding beta-propeller fold protein YncE
VTIINGVTNSTTTVTDPKALHPSAVAVNPVTNKIYVAKKFSHTSQFSMRPMKKMRLQSASPRPKMLPVLKSGAGAISRDVAGGGAFWTTFSQQTF